MPWLALTVELEAAQAEAMSEALLEAGAASVSIEDPEAARSRLRALLEADADAAALLAAAAARAGCAVPPFRTEAVADQDWVRATQAQFAPLCVAGRLWIVPTWHAAPQDGIVLRLDPGLAFGTGSHPSTRLALAWLARTLAPGASVLDYGCGSGILAIAAAKLGAVRVDAVDVDPLALATTRDNARANGVALRALAPDELPPGDYDVVVANILSQPLIVLEPLLAARTRRGGRIALSGILETQAAEVAAAYGAHFEPRAGDMEEGWALVEGRRR
ncbi:MAG TPA: 50S ribosomal protein L11 methyltransferase [Burkholderiales bacterium]|nr:50S ribosomal protein L11 methyltransferase [Burkholderiales bacterium]